MPPVLSFKSILKREAKDSSIFTFAIYLPVAVNFFLIPFYWQKLTPTDFGIIAIVEIITVYISIFSGLKLEESVKRFYYEWDVDSRKENITTLWIIQWGSNVVFGLLALAIVYLSHDFFFPDVAFKYFILGLISYTLETLFVLPTTLVRVQKRPVLFSVISLTKSFLLIGFNIYFILILQWGLTGFFIANLIGHGIIAVLGLSIMISVFTWKFNYKELKVAFRFSLPLIPTLAIASISKTVDKILLQKFVSTEALGLFSQALKISGLINKLYQAIKTSYVPFLYKFIFEDKRNEVVFRMSKFYLAPLFIASFSLFVFADEIIIWIDRPAYLEIIQYLPYLIFIELISSIVIFYAPGIGIAKKNELLVIPTTVNSLITIIGGFVLIPFLQLYGIIILRLLLTISNLIIRIILSLKVYDMKYDWQALFFYLFTYIALSLTGSFLSFQNLLYNLLFGAGLVFIQLCFIGIYLVINKSSGYTER
ncbi:oligosaccharide flippase family protein [bacterium]|nr:oligosaccharide flippase family protein [bacterium]